MPTTKFDQIVAGITSALRKIPEDKWAHAVVGLFVAYATALLTLAIEGSTQNVARYSALALVAVAIAKEVYDYFNRDVHTPDVMDAVATVLGGLPITLLVYLLTRG